MALVTVILVNDDTHSATDPMIAMPRFLPLVAAEPAPVRPELRDPVAAGGRGLELASGAQ